MVPGRRCHRGHKGNRHKRPQQLRYEASPLGVTLPKRYPLDSSAKRSQGAILSMLLQNSLHRQRRRHQRHTRTLRNMVTASPVHVAKTLLVHTESFDVGLRAPIAVTAWTRPRNIPHSSKHWRRRIPRSCRCARQAGRRRKGTVHAPSAPRLATLGPLGPKPPQTSRPSSRSYL